jgi:hypothetical protein
MPSYLVRSQFALADQFVRFRWANVCTLAELLNGEGECRHIVVLLNGEIQFHGGPS